jgi:hypothetical protein
MSWVNGTDDEEFIIHIPKSPQREKALKQLRQEIMELSLLIAMARRLGIDSSETERERRIYIDRAQAIRKAMDDDTRDTEMGEDNSEELYLEARQSA